MKQIHLSGCLLVNCMHTELHFFACRSKSLSPDHTELKPISERREHSPEPHPKLRTQKAHLAHREASSVVQEQQHHKSAGTSSHVPWAGSEQAFLGESKKKAAELGQPSSASRELVGCLQGFVEPFFMLQQMCKYLGLIKG